MTDKKEDPRYRWVADETDETTFNVEGPWVFVAKDAHKVKLGGTVRPEQICFMDYLVEKGFFANRSDFCTQALVYLVATSQDVSPTSEDVNFSKIMKEARKKIGGKGEIPMPEGKIKKKVGFATSPFLCLLMDLSIQQGSSRNRSHVITKALDGFIEFLLQMDFVPESDANKFYSDIFRESD